MLTFLNQLKRGRLGGHPIHSMLVHFPSALFPTSLAFDILAILFQNECLACAGFYSIAAGLLLGFCAVFFGAIDYVRLPATHPAWNKASIHALLNIVWLSVFGIIFGLRLKEFPVIRFESLAEIVISFFTVIGLIGSNYLGGELVFRHKLGFAEQEYHTDSRKKKNRR